MFTLRYATPSDIYQIMEIEKDSFISQTQESKDVFLKRIKTFSNGFILLIDTRINKIIGYFCSELWNSIPTEKNSFSIGHDISSLHFNKGKILYISSFAILKDYRGNGFGRKFFSDSIDFICNKLEISKIALIVNDKCVNAYHIYSNYGFSDVYMIKDFFVDGNGILMQKDVINK